MSISVALERKLDQAKDSAYQNIVDEVAGLMIRDNIEYANALLSTNSSLDTLDLYFLPFRDARLNRELLTQGDFLNPQNWQMNRHHLHKVIMHSTTDLGNLNDYGNSIITRGGTAAGKSFHIRNNIVGIPILDPDVIKERLVEVHNEEIKPHQIHGEGIVISVLLERELLSRTASFVRNKRHITASVVRQFVDSLDGYNNIMILDFDIPAPLALLRSTERKLRDDVSVIAPGKLIEDLSIIREQRGIVQKLVQTDNRINYELNAPGGEDYFAAIDPDRLLSQIVDEQMLKYYYSLGIVSEESLRFYQNNLIGKNLGELY